MASRCLPIPCVRSWGTLRFSVGLPVRHPGSLSPDGCPTSLVAFQDSGPAPLPLHRARKMIRALVEEINQRPLLGGSRDEVTSLPLILHLKGLGCQEGY